MKKAVLATVLILAGGAAHASTILFSGGSNNQTSVNLSVDGVDVTASAFGTDYDPTSGTGTSVAINRGNNGWGAQGGAERGRLAGGEALVFDFGSEVVRLGSSSVFEAGGQAEAFDLYVDGSLVGSFNLAADAGNSFDLFDFSGQNVTGSTFAFVGTVPNGGGNRGVRIREIEFSVVPLPAGFPMLLGGLGLMWAMRRKKA